MNNVRFERLSLWENNEPLEEAMLKSCLIFNRKASKDNRDGFFEKYVLSLIMAEEARSTDDIEHMVNEHYGEGFVDKVQINKALSELSKKKFVRLAEDGGWIPIDKSGAQYISELNQRIEELINEIYSIAKNACAKCNIQISNKEATVKRNIKDCLSYYFAVSGYSFFYFDGQRVDVGHNIETLKDIDEVAGKGLPKNVTLHIINSIGRFLKEHSKEHGQTLQKLGNAYITAQVMGIDPLLNNFKQQKISEKVFVVDTDVVLYYITEHGRYSAEYKKMINQLLACGCKLYIPMEVIEEVYKHGEAANKQYGFYGNAIETNSIDISEISHNVFIEDYACDARKRERKYGNWGNYIGNVYNPRHGVDQTYDVIKCKFDKFKGNVIYGKIPEGSTIDEQLLSDMHDSALKRTQNTQKGFHRKDKENEAVTQTDLSLFLSVRSLNTNNDNYPMGNVRHGLLKHKYYLLSSTTRIQDCAIENGISDKVICNPKALISYLSEAGLMKKEEKGIINLFENRFLMHVANEIEETISDFIKIGLNLKGQDLVSMRYALEDETHNLLTSQSSDDYKQYYEHVTAKGYRFAPYAQDIFRENKEQAEEINRLKEQLKQFEEKEEKRKKQIEKKYYEDRIKRTKKGKQHKKGTHKQ